LRSIYDIVGGDEKYILICGKDSEGKKIRDLCVDGRLVLKGSLMNEDGRTWTRLISLRIGTSDRLL
jgi:hypothetical protein